MSEYQYSFAELFRGFRLRRDVTLKEVAMDLGLHENTVKRWNQGVSLPRYETHIFQLKELLELEPAEANRLLTSAGFSPNFSVPQKQNSSPLPVQLLHREKIYVGRNELKKVLLRKVRLGQVTTVVGPAGAGKTSLVAEVLHDLETQGELLKRFPDGVIVVELYVTTDENSVFRHIVHSLGESAGDWPKWSARRVLAGRKLLVILDGAEAMSSLTVILEVVSNCGVIITSRNRHDAPDGSWIEVGMMEKNEGVTLLQKWTGIETDVGQLAEIYRLVDGLPLALSLAGKYLQRHPDMDAFIEELRTEPIDSLIFGTHSNESVARLIGRSLSQLAPQTQELVSIFGVLAFRPVPMAWLTRLMERSDLQLRRALNTLVDYHLVANEEVSYRPTHVLIYHYLRQHGTLPVTRVASLLEQFNQSKQGADAVLQPGETEHLLAIARWLHQRAAWTAMMALLDPILTLAKQGRNPTVVTLLEITREAADSLEQTEALCQIDIQLGEERRDTGHLEEARQILQQCHNRSRKIHNRLLEARSAQRLATVFAMLGQMEKAQALFEEALVSYEALAEMQDMGTVLGNLGHFSNLMGRYDRSQSYFQKAIEVAQEIGDTRNEARWLSGLADCHYRLGATQKAIAVYESALLLCQQHQLRHAEAICLDGLGMCYKQLGDIDTAVQYHEASRKLAEEVGNQFGVLASLTNIGSAYLDILQLPEKALANFEQALLLNQQIGHGHAEAILRSNLGEAYLAIGNLAAAERFLQSALRLRETVQDLRHQANVTGSLGEVYRQQGKLDKSESHFQRAVSQCREIGEQRGVAIHLAYLGRLSEQQGDTEAAITWLTEALALFESIGDSYEIAQWSLCLARVKQAFGQQAEAGRLLVRAAAVCPQSAEKLLRQIMQAQIVE